MNKKEIYDLIDLKIRIKYRTQTELAKKLGITRATLNNNLKKLKLEENITYDVLEKILDALDLEVKIIEKTNRQ